MLFAIQPIKNNVMKIINADGIGLCKINIPVFSNESIIQLIIISSFIFYLLPKVIFSAIYTVADSPVTVFLISHFCRLLVSLGVIGVSLIPRIQSDDTLNNLHNCIRYRIGNSFIPFSYLEYCCCVIISASAVCACDSPLSFLALASFCVYSIVNPPHNLFTYNKFILQRKKCIDKHQLGCYTSVTTPLVL